MKKILTVLLLGIGVLAYAQDQNQTQDQPQAPQEKTLIDFSTYEELNGAEGSPYAENSAEDLGPLSHYSITKEDMRLDQWVVRLNSSAHTVANIRGSYAKSITTRAGDKVLGARIHFPYTPNPAHAFIRPFYEIMEYNNQGKLSNIGNGVVDNVQTIKSISAVVSGRNYNNRLSIRLMDQNRNTKDFFLGYLHFTGFRKLRWVNTEYIADARSRNLFHTPLYPKEPPYYKFDSFIVTRPEDSHGGDFVVYIKNVTIDYDVYDAVSQNFEIQDEASWGIQKFLAISKASIIKRISAEKKELLSVEIQKTNKPTSPQTEQKAATSN